MNKEIRHGLVAALLLVSAGAQAAMSATELALVQADAWRVWMGFHLLSVRGDNPEDRAALKALLADGEQHLDALKAQAAPGEKDTAANGCRLKRATPQRQNVEVMNSFQRGEPLRRDPVPAAFGCRAY